MTTAVFSAMEGDEPLPLDIPTPEALAVHPVADLFPMLADDELAELAADIKQRGQLQPIVLDSEGQVLDGRNRLAACRIAGVEPKFDYYTGEDPDGYALAVNGQRRDLTAGKRAMVAARASKLEGLSGSEVARTLRVPESRVSEAKTILGYAEDLSVRVLDGTMPLVDAYEIARRRKADTERARAKMSRLRDEAPDLLALVDEGRMSLDDAIAALDAREEKAKQELDAEARAEQEREAQERERRQRLTRSFGEAIAALSSLLDPDPIAFATDTYDPDANPHRITLAKSAFTATGLAQIADRLGQLAEHVGSNGGKL